VEINLNKILKDKNNEDIEADLVRNSSRLGIKRKNGKYEYKRRVKSNISSSLENKELSIKQKNKNGSREKKVIRKKSHNKKHDIWVDTGIPSSSQITKFLKRKREESINTRKKNKKNNEKEEKKDRKDEKKRKKDFEEHQESSMNKEARIQLEGKRSTTTSEDIRRYFRTEDKH